MDDIIELGNLVKTTADILKSILTLSKSEASQDVPKDFATSLNNKVVEMQEVVMSAQSRALAAQASQATLLDQERILKERIAEFENWEAEKVRYELHDMGTNGVTGLVYRLREKCVQGSEPIYHICSTCYEDGKKSILQSPVERKGGNRNFLVCTRCKAEYRVIYNH